MGSIQQKLLDKAKSLPQKPGCYLMKNQKDSVIYVGKAKNLKNRVSSYFQNSQKGPKTEILVSHIKEFDFFLTETEAEAFVLENNLIKKYGPKYNILLRDDKSYPYVVIDRTTPFPRLQYQRRVKRSKGKEVYGPFVHGSNISEVLRILTKSFLLRDCSLREFNSRKEPCLLYQIKQCSAPCVQKIETKDYDHYLNLAVSFLKARPDIPLDHLRQRMEDLSNSEEFEHAAIIRDHIEILTSFMDYSKQKNAEIHGGVQNIDVIAYHQGEVEIDISLYMVRNGLLLGHKNFHFLADDMNEKIDSQVANFMFQYYSSSLDTYPEVIVCPFEQENLDLFQIGIRTLSKIECLAPKNKYQSLMKLTQDHAYEHQRVRIKNEESVFVGLNKLKDLLSLSERPVSLECYDIAIFQGQSPTAAQITFVDGVPDKKKYRHYHLETRPEGNNDFAMMEEVLRRRIKHGELPDIFIVDGGKGQISIFTAVLKDLSIDIPVVGIAKSKGKSDFSSSKVQKSEERLFIPGRLNPYYLNKNKSLFKIVTQMRDEAHRFSRRLHHNAEKKRTLSSWIDQVEGIGPKTKKNILMNLTKSVQELRSLSVSELVKEFNINHKTAINIKKTLNEKTN